MRGWAALLSMVLAASASPSAPPRETPPPPPAAAFYPPPMIAADPKVAIDPPPPSWIAATRAPEFRKCAACHNVEKDGKNGIGPNLYGVFGRPPLGPIIAIRRSFGTRDWSGISRRSTAGSPVRERSCPEPK